MRCRVVEAAKPAERRKRPRRRTPFRRVRTRLRALDGRTARLLGPHVPFGHLDMVEPVPIGVSAALAVLSLRIRLRFDEPRPVRLPRALHNGPGSDHAACAAAGTGTASRGQSSPLASGWAAMNLS